MKIIRISEGGNINFQKEDRDTNLKGENSVIRRGSDEIVVKLKSLDFPNTIKEEMKVIQRDMSMVQAELDAISQISNLLKNSQDQEEIYRGIRNIYNQAKYEDIYLLDNIKEDLFSNDVPRILQALEKEVKSLSSKFEENRKNTNALLVKFQNITTFIETVSNDQIDGTIRLISKLSDQGIFKISPQNVIKFLSN